LRRRFDKKVWVERSGSLLVHLDELIANFPDARFVHLYRDGRECAISMAGHSAFRLSIVTGRLMETLGIDPFNTDEPGTGVVPDDLRPFMPETFDADAFWKFDLPIEKLGASWSNAESHALTLMAQLPSGRVYQLRYENLVAAPEQELAALATFIGIHEPNKEWLKAAASLVKVKPPALPTLPEGERARLEESCRIAMGLLYGADVLEPIPV
jgi:Sulfotransferase domain.